MCTLAGMLCTVEPAVWRSVSNALWTGDCSTRGWRGGFMEGVTGGATGGAFTEKGAGGGAALAWLGSSCLLFSVFTFCSCPWIFFSLFWGQPRLALGRLDGRPGIINTDDAFSVRSVVSPG